jgi:hypothetical protein
MYIMPPCRIKYWNWKKSKQLVLPITSCSFIFVPHLPRPAMRCSINYIHSPTGAILATLYTSADQEIRGPYGNVEFIIVFPATSLYPESAKYGSRLILILSSHLWLYLPNNSLFHVPSRFPTKTLYAFWSLPRVIRTPPVLFWLLPS